MFEITVPPMVIDLGPIPGPDPATTLVALVALAATLDTDTPEGNP